MAALDLYWFDLDVAAGLQAAWRAWLAPEERARADRYLLPRHGERYVAAHAQLRWLLAQRLRGAPRELEFELGVQGKPRVRGARLHFNLSHSGPWGLVGIAADQEVGVDIEGERPAMDGVGLAQRFFTPAETAWLREQPAEQRARAFARLWTCKEAWLKADGRGLALSLRRIEVSFAGAGAELRSLDDAPGQTWFVREFDLVPGYAAAAVLPAAPSAVTVQRLAPPAA
ncbi:MAG TPA: 4'-phosphopantetheinyl transferase superfamily protein [Terriglobales bacterium]|nr:4'-phosphopantetheinyl transferase superfamily protein [Terriglobales bacterium]